MSEKNRNFTGEIANPADFEKAIREIKESWAKQTPAVLDTAQLIFNTWEKFPGQQKRLAIELDMHPSELNKWIAVGRCGQLHDASLRDKLPPGLSLQYELTRVKYLDDAVRDGKIHSGLKRVEIQALRKIYSTRTFPHIKSPPTQAEIGQVIAQTFESAPRRPDKYERKLPDGVCAIVRLPESREQQLAIQDAVTTMRKAGVQVHDIWAIQMSNVDAELASIEANVVRKARIEVRKLVKAKKAEYRRRGKLHEFVKIFGYDEELDTKGANLSQLEYIFEQLEGKGPFDSFIMDIRKGTSGRSYPSIVIPSFDLTDEELREQAQDKETVQALTDRLRPGAGKSKDFSGVDFS